MKELQIDSRILDAAVAFVGFLVAMAAIWLQWQHFKKNHPIGAGGNTLAPFGKPSPRNRWKVLYWREVRATFALAVISLCMVGIIVFIRREITMLSIASLMFWIGMFFYNLWVAQWYAWRIATKRKR